MNITLKYKQLPEDVAKAKKNAILRIVAKALRRQKNNKRKEVIEEVKKNRVLQ